MGAPDGGSEISDPNLDDPPKATGSAHAKPDLDARLHDPGIARGPSVFLADTIRVVGVSEDFEFSPVSGGRREHVEETLASESRSR